MGQQQPKNNKNKKQKGFIGKIFGNTPKHIMNETESVLGTNTTNSIKNDAKYVNKEANSQINKAANAFNKEANSAFNSLFGTEKKKKVQPQPQPQIVYAQQPQGQQQVVYAQQPQQGQQPQAAYYVQNSNIKK